MPYLPIDSDEDPGFFDTLPKMKEVTPASADIAWFVYDLVHNTKSNSYELKRCKTMYTNFAESLDKITRSEPGNMGDFIAVLQGKVDEKLDNNPPDTKLIDAPF
jgi:hypothetical protein